MLQTGLKTILNWVQFFDEMDFQSAIWFISKVLNKEELVKEDKKKIYLFLWKQPIAIWKLNHFSNLLDAKKSERGLSDRKMIRNFGKLASFEDIFTWIIIIRFDFETLMVHVKKLNTGSNMKNQKVMFWDRILTKFARKKAFKMRWDSINKWINK